MDLNVQVSSEEIIRVDIKMRSCSTCINNNNKKDQIVFMLKLKLFVKVKL